jgi:hypothetical protein
MRSDGDGNAMLIRNVDAEVEECMEIRRKYSTNQGLEGRIWQSGAHSMGGGPRRQRDHRSCCISRMG